MGTTSLCAHPPRASAPDADKLTSPVGQLAARMAGLGVDPAAIGWLDSTYAVTGGSVPVRVAGAGVVAAVTASGLSSEQDHDFVVQGLETYLATRQR